MEILKEKEEKMVKFEIELSPKETKLLLDYAETNIIKDQNALLNWAINDILDKQRSRAKKAEKLNKRSKNAKAKG